MKPGFEEIELDLGRVPTVAEGYERAKDDLGDILDLTRHHMGGGEVPLFRESLAFMSFVNRAQSLHQGIVGAVETHNSHVAFTLLRAYLELVVLVYYLRDFPDYLDALERPMSELPKNTRKRFAELFDHAGKDMKGVARVYEVLNEMAHFGSTALWAPFTITDEKERNLSYGTPPHWKDPEHARVALAMLQEADENFTAVLDRYADRQLTPKVTAYQGRERIKVALASVGLVPDPNPDALGTVSEDLGKRTQADEILYWCDEHQAWELTESATPERVEEWARSLAAEASAESEVVEP
jgi:hypothetical protein